MGVLWAAGLPALSSESDHCYVTAINQRAVGGAAKAAWGLGCSYKPLPQPPEDSLAPVHLWRVGGGRLQTRNACPQRSVSSNGCSLLAQQFNLPGVQGMANLATLKSVLTINEKLPG